MSVCFPKAEPAYMGVNEPSRIECDIFELEYEGELPPELHSGAFYRCGADPQFPPRLGRDILVNGDGMVSMFRFNGGHVDFKMRWVQTDKWKAERKARKALFGAYRNPYTDDPSVAGVDRTTANTSILWHAGRLYALKEDGLPHELDPFTLETKGKWSFDRQWRSKTFTAHPKKDTSTGELVFYGYASEGEATRCVAVGRSNAAGDLSSEDWFVPPYASMIHDFAVTEQHIAFMIMPLTSDMDRLKQGGSHWAWDGTKVTHIGIMPRNGRTEEMRYFRGPARWSFHVLNGHTEGSQVHIDLCVNESNPAPFFPDLQGNPWDPVKGQSYLTRWTCDLSQNDENARFTEQRLFTCPADFPDTDPRFQMRKYRHGYVAARDLARPLDPKRNFGGFGFNIITHIDHGTGKIETYYVGDESSVQEPVFVPRVPYGPEGYGYLLAVVNRLAGNTSDLIVLDALDISGGPVATIHIPMRLRTAFHGLFVPESDLMKSYCRGRSEETVTAPGAAISNG